MKKLFVVTTLALALALCAAAAPVQAKTLKWAFQGDLMSLDPYSLNETFLQGMLGNVYEGLVRRDANLKMQPCLAVKWEVKEPTRWRFFLRKGVKFHNGNTFNADDVIFSFHRVIGEGSDYRARFSSIKEMKKVDDYTIDVITKQPNPILISEWATWFIMDKEWCEEHKATESANVKTGKENYATRHENGTGPFVVTERQKDVKTVLKPYKGWWDKPKHNLTEVIFTPISSDATRVAALLSGEIDMMYPVPVQDIKRINSNKGTSVLVGPELRTVFLGFNQSTDTLKGATNVKGKNPFKDKRVRQAFYQAINIKAIKKKIMRGMSEPSALLISPLLFPSYGKDFKRYPYDPKKSKKLLAEAGYPKGFEVSMDCPNNRYVNDEQICQAAVSMLAKVGVKVNLKAQPKAQYFKKILSYDTDFYMLGWTPSSLDSWNVLFNLIDTREKGGRGKFNLGGYSNPKVDALTDKVLSETDLDKRNKMIKEAYTLLNKDAGYIPLHQQSLAWGKKDKVSLKQRADNMFRFIYVTVK